MTREFLVVTKRPRGKKTNFSPPNSAHRRDDGSNGALTFDPGVPLRSSRGASSRTCRGTRRRPRTSRRPTCPSRRTRRCCRLGVEEAKFKNEQTQEIYSFKADKHVIHKNRDIFTVQLLHTAFNGRGKSSGVQKSCVHWHKQSVVFDFGDLVPQHWLSAVTYKEKYSYIWLYTFHRWFIFISYSQFIETTQASEPSREQHEPNRSNSVKVCWIMCRIQS